LRSRGVAGRPDWRPVSAAGGRQLGGRGPAQARAGGAPAGRSAGRVRRPGPGRVSTAQRHSLASTACHSSAGVQLGGVLAGGRGAQLAPGPVALRLDGGCPLGGRQLGGRGPAQARAGGARQTARRDECGVQGQVGRARLSGTPWHRRPAVRAADATPEAWRSLLAHPSMEELREPAEQEGIALAKSPSVIPDQSAQRREI
jgi:hypothetical protein